jgi:hypothetical protein
VRDVLWIAGIIFLIVPGSVLWRLPTVRGLDLPARLAIGFAGGIVMTSTLLMLYSFAHLPWTRTTVGIPLLALGAFGVRRGERASRPQSPGVPPGDNGSRAGRPTAAGWKPALLITIFIVLTIYGVATARETCGDLIYFWGPKGQRFHHAGKIDADFLEFPHYNLMHPDYPPLLPLTYAWASLVAHRFSWWGALLVMPIALAATSFAFRGLMRELAGDERAGWYAVLLTAILAYGSAVGMTAGAAEPVLLLFEVIAITTLTFGRDDRDMHLIAAVALAGAAMTKVEGAAFVAIAVIAYLISTRRVWRAIATAAPAVILLGCWLLFAQRHHLLDSYAQAKNPLHFDLLGPTLTGMLRQASYNLGYVPWIAALAPLTVRRGWRPALLPILAAAGTLASIIFFYMHADNPAWWIEASAHRVLLTPLACLVIASVAASDRVAADGLVPQGEEAKGADGETGRHPGRALDQVR